MGILNLRNPNGYDGSPATQTKQGIVRMATDAEAAAGTATNVAISPATAQAATALDFASPPVLGFGSTTPRPVHATTLDSTSTTSLATGAGTVANVGNATGTIGFFGATAVAKPASTDDLRTALINLGLYTTGGATPLNLNGGTLTAGVVTSTGAVTGTSLTATTGAITATLGAVSAATTVTGGTGVIATTGNVSATAGAVNAGTSITATLGNITATNGNIVRGTAGNKDVYSSVATTTAAGANSAGTVALANGEAVVATTAVTASSQIRLYRQGVGATGAAALGILTIFAISAGVSFTIRAVQPADATAAQAADLSVIGWEIVN